VIIICLCLLLDILRLIVGAEQAKIWWSGAERSLAERSLAERSGEWALQKNGGAERGAGSGGAGAERRAGVTDKLECRSALSPITLRSHALVYMLGESINQSIIHSINEAGSKLLR